MKKELEGPKVEDIGIAIVKELGSEKTEVYNAYLINFKEDSIEGVLISSRGYGIDRNSNEEIKTSQLRHFLDIVPGKSFKKIEPIMEDVFGLNNEYWLSFFYEGKMFDKKYIFLPESILDSNLIDIEIINKKGILIK